MKSFVERLERALFDAYLDGCHESMKDETWKNDYMQKIIKKHKLDMINRREQNGK